jgi:NAD+ kinase
VNELRSGARVQKLRAVILGSGDRRPEILRQIRSLRPVIESHAEVVHEDLTFSQNSFGQELSAAEANIAIVLGGDGSILRAARHMGDRQLPVLGVNLGKLGFLADTSPGHLEIALSRVRSGEFELIDHLMLHCEVVVDDRIAVDEIGLNELAILTGPPFSMQHIDLYVDGLLATSYSCDGIIISTPVGSTAHSLSAGGPILRKDLQAFVVSPINPHTLTVRPVVDSADRVLELVVQSPGETTSAVLDGQVLTRLHRADRVRIRRAKPVFRMIQVSGNDYYQTLRKKLGWSGFINNQN